MGWQNGITVLTRYDFCVCSHSIYYFLTKQSFGECTLRDSRIKSIKCSFILFFVGAGHQFVQNADHKQGGKQEAIVQGVEELFNILPGSGGSYRFCDELAQEGDHGNLDENNYMKNSGMDIVDFGRDQAGEGPNDEKSSKWLQKSMGKIIVLHGMKNRNGKLPHDHHTRKHQCYSKECVKDMIKNLFVNNTSFPKCYYGRSHVQ